MKSVAGAGRVCWSRCCGPPWASGRRAGAAGARAAASSSTDPRVGLKPGLRRTPGRPRATWSSSPACPSRQGSSIPKMPAGEPTEPEAEAKPDAKPDAKPEATKPTPSNRTPQPPAPQRGGGLNFANSDLAFSGQHLFIGNFNGFNVYDLGNPTKPKLLASIVCPGGQGDVSVHGNLLVMSVEQTRGRHRLRHAGRRAGGQHRALPRRPHLRHHRREEAEAGRRRADVPRIAHAHARRRIPSDKANLYVYGSGTGTVRSARGARRLFGRRSEGRSEHRALQHRRHPDPARRPGEGAHRQPAAHLRRPDDRRDLRPLAGRQPRTRHAEDRR